VIATDADETMIERANAACYTASSLKDLPEESVGRAFTRSGPLFCLTPEFRKGVELVQQDIRREMPNGTFDLILCRNLVFSYFDEGLQRRISGQLRERLRPAAFPYWESTKLCRPMPTVLCSLHLTCRLPAGGVMQSCEILDNLVPTFRTR
jgi:chemotaxis methyl-accepting protein methylase